MTNIVSHPTRVRALRESFRALRDAEFPWTADTIYLNNATPSPRSAPLPISSPIVICRPAWRRRAIPPPG